MIRSQDRTIGQIEFLRNGVFEKRRILCFLRLRRLLELLLLRLSEKCATKLLIVVRRANYLLLVWLLCRIIVNSSSFIKGGFDSFISKRTNIDISRRRSSSSLSLNKRTRNCCLFCVLYCAVILLGCFLQTRGFNVLRGVVTRAFLHGMYFSY